MAKLESLLQEMDLQTDKKIEEPKKKMPKVKRRAWLEEKTSEPTSPARTELSKHKQKKAASLSGEGPIALSNLRGNPRKVIFVLYHLAREDYDPFITGKVTPNEILSYINISIHSLKTAISFLIKNQALSKVKVEAGKSGGTIYQIHKDLCSQIKESIKDEEVLNEFYFLETK